MRNIKYLLILLFAMSQLACTEDLYTDLEGSTNASSRVDSEAVAAGTDKTIALECSPFTHDSMAVRGIFQVFRRPNTLEVINDYMLLKLSQWPSQLSDSGSYFMQFFSITGDNGFREVNSQATPIFFINYATGDILNEHSPVNNISKSVIESVISQFNLGSVGINAANFLRAYAPVLKNVSLEYDAVLVTLYDGANNNRIVGNTDVLLPAFEANPNAYAATHVSFLESLHPLYDRRNSGLTESQFKSEGIRMCNQYL